MLNSVPAAAIGGDCGPGELNLGGVPAVDPALDAPPPNVKPPGAAGAAPPPPNEKDGAAGAAPPPKTGAGADDPPNGLGLDGARAGEVAPPKPPWAG